MGAAWYEPQLCRCPASTHWADNQPTSTEEAWGHYQHDRAVSAATSGMNTGPECAPDVLAACWDLRTTTKRVSLVYRTDGRPIRRAEVDQRTAAAAFRNHLRRRLGRGRTAGSRPTCIVPSRPRLTRSGVRDLSTSGSTRWRARRTSWNCDGARLTWRTGRASRGFDCAATTELRRPMTSVRQRSVSCPQRSGNGGARSRRGSVARARSPPLRLPPLFPFVAGAGAPHPGVPVGRHLKWGEPVRADPFSMVWPQV